MWYIGCALGFQPSDPELIGTATKMDVLIAAVGTFVSVVLIAVLLMRPPGGTL